MRRLPALLLLGVVLLFILPSSVQYYTDWLWFRELGYEGIFLRTLNAQLTVFTATFAGGLPVSVPQSPHRARHDQPAAHHDWHRRGRPRRSRWIPVPLARLALPAAAIVAFGLGIAGARNWMLWLNFANGHAVRPAPIRCSAATSSFYVFRLPVWQRSCSSRRCSSSILALVGCGLYYVLSGSFVIEPRTQAGFWPRHPPRDVGAAASRPAGGPVVPGLLAWGTWLELPAAAAHARRTSLFGASYADVHARLPMLWLTIAVLGAGAALAVVQGFSRRGWPLPLAIALYFGRHDRRRHLRRVGAALLGDAERAQPRAAVPRQQHRGHPARLRARPRRGTRALRRRRADGQGHHRQRVHDRERAAVGPPAAAADVRADPGNPDLLRLQERRQRPLHDRRQVPAGHAVGARAESRQHSQPHRGSTSG